MNMDGPGSSDEMDYEDFMIPQGGSAGVGFVFPATPYVEKPPRTSQVAPALVVPEGAVTPVAAAPEESGVGDRSRSPSPSAHDAHFPTPRKSLHTPDSPSLLPSLPLQLSHTPHTPVPDEGKAPHATKNLIKIFTSSPSNTTTTPQQPNETLLEDFDAEELAASEAKSDAIADLIADIKRLAARDRALQCRIADLIKRQNQRPAQRLQAEITKRQKMLAELEQAAKQQNEEQQAADEHIRLLEQELADLKQERAEAQSVGDVSSVSPTSNGLAALWVFLKCGIIVLMIILVAEVALRYSDSCWDSLRSYATSAADSLEFTLERPS